jgi:hypothetical protein
MDKLLNVVQEHGAPSQEDAASHQLTKELAIKGKIVLAVVLSLTAEMAFAHSSDSPTSPYSPSPFQSSSSSMRLPKAEQHSLLSYCGIMAEQAQKQMRELIGSASPGTVKVVEIQQHLKEVHFAVNSMFEDHKRLLDSLSEDQWRDSKAEITKLEMLRIDIQTYLQGIELELQLPSPDSKVFKRYSTKMKTALQRWRKQHHKMTADIGIHF